MKVSYTCFEVSSVCNMDCKFCFSNWRENREQLKSEKILHIINELKEAGLEGINITGGDPLLRDDIIEICKYCKNLGITTIISTNGIELLKKEKVMEYIDSINLPLDSHIASVHNYMRPCMVKNHHKLILELIDFISKKYPNVKIKINTMVSNVNKDSVIKIGELIEGKAYSWKLSKFYNSGYGKNFEKEFDIGMKDFNQIVSACKDKYKKSKIVEEEFNIQKDEVFDLFIDGYGKINLHTKHGIKNCGDIDKLSKLNINDDLNKEYLEEVYM